MRTSLPSPKSITWWSWLLIALVTLIVMAPWWRNHGYLRSFFDYGVVMGGIGRINDGQRPYVDFISPIQTGWYVLNGLAEKIGGGTYQAMTLSGAACILVSLATLILILARRWPLAWATVVAGAVVTGTASQHTLIWYNSWGVILLAVVAWTGALFPVLRRENWAWHGLAGVALFFGEINKINMELMALGLGLAWAVRAALTGRSGWGRVVATGAFYFGCAALAVVAELVWTGATLAAWWHDVVALPAAARSGMVLAGIKPDFLLKILHDYYGPQALPQSALVGLLATVITCAGIMRKTWSQPGWVEKALPPLCGAVACLGGVVLLTTNMDISYIGAAGWLTLVVALWLGYDMPARGWWFYSAVIVPLALVAVAAWPSAWKGQRSQFGHSAAARSDYVSGDRGGPDFAYLRGTLMPPDVVDSLKSMAKWHDGLSPERKRAVFYGPGTDWAARIWPAMRTPGLPTYVQAGSSVGQAEQDLFFGLLRGGTLSEIPVSRVQDLFWGRERLILDHRYEKSPLGSEFAVYSKFPMPGVSMAPVWFTRIFGGNTDSRYLVSEAEYMPMSDWRMFLGFTEGNGVMRLTLPTNRLQGDVVLRRADGAPKVAAAVEFNIFAEANPTARFPRWSQRVQLAADQEEVMAHYEIDSSHLPTLFELKIPPELAGQVVAGWRGPRIFHTGEENSGPPNWFYRGEGAIVALDDAMLGKLLPDAWRPDEAWMRHGRATAEGIELSPGGEIWLRTHGVVSAFAGTVRAVGPLNLRPGEVVTVRGMWYLGGRLEDYSDMVVRPDGTAEFHAWVAERAGWIVIGVDPQANAPALRVWVDRVEQR